ncbi:MAG: hypothetical protein E4G96_02460 [Chrysiogenales bacterium]|nr:MAG: hypothetical protein E4G96_02460 [Chrysiogenales bacterium]
MPFYGALKAMGGDAGFPMNQPPGVASTVELGRRIWKLLPERRIAKKRIDPLLDEIAALCR